ncbi:hypothetical protein M0R72_09385 [Candidatus Pacearchaeota archaeon]|jgi:hypothetical protein|nr:hypothetical protein [Candidatus Pacearchaeota archaeon]
MPRIQKTKKPLRKPTTTKQKPNKVKGKAKHPVKAPRKALGASQSPGKPLPTPQAKATPKGKPRLVSTEADIGKRFLEVGQEEAEAAATKPPGKFSNGIELREGLIHRSEDSVIKAPVSQPMMKALGVLADTHKTAEPPKSELELLIETVNHKHMDTLRLGKAFVASALEVEAALDKASKRAAGVGWELRGVTAVSEVDKSVYRRVGLAKTERIANLVSPISRANLSEVLRVMQDLGLQIQED